MGMIDPGRRGSDENDASARETARDDQIAEIFVTRDEGLTVRNAMRQNLFIARPGESRFRGGLNFMPQGSEERQGDRIDILVREETHALILRSGVDLLGSDDPAGVFHARLDVLRRKRRVVIAANGIERNPCRYEFQHLVNRDSRAADAGLAQVNRRVRRDAFENIHHKYLRPNSRVAQG